MKTGIFYLLAAAAFSAGLTGCSFDEVSPTPEAQIHISAQIESLSKAPSLNDSGIFTSGDVFTLLATGSKSQSAPMEYRVGNSTL